MSDKETTCDAKSEKELEVNSISSDKSVKSRNSYTNKEKKKALVSLQNEFKGNISACSRELGIKRRTLNEWSKNGIDSYDKDEKRKRNKPCDNEAIRNRGQWPDLENALNEQLKNDKISIITEKLIKELAVKIMKQKHPKENFKASNGWYQNFCKRLGIKVKNGNVTYVEEAFSSSSVESDDEDGLSQENSFKVKPKSSFSIENQVNSPDEEWKKYLNNENGNHVLAESEVELNSDPFMGDNRLIQSNEVNFGLDGDSGLYATPVLLPQDDLFNNYLAEGTATADLGEELGNQEVEIGGDRAEVLSSNDYMEIEESEAPKTAVEAAEVGVKIK